MRMLMALAALILLAGCNKASLIEHFSTPEDQALAKRYIEQLRARQFDEIDRALDPSLRKGDVRGMLAQMAAMIPAGEPTSLKPVGATKFFNGGAMSLNTTFEYGFGDRWFLINVAVQEKDGKKTIIGFNVAPTKDSLEQQSRFPLVGLSGLHYAVLAWAVAALALTGYALVACARIKGLRRKWLWILFILCGFGGLAINWYTGAWSFQPLRVQLLSVSAFAPLYGPWTVMVSMPLGALVFLFRRKKLETLAAANGIAPPVAPDAP